MPIVDFLTNSRFEQTLNTSANVLGGAIAPQQLSISKQSLEISKQLLKIFKEEHIKEDIRDNDRDKMFLEILSELRKLNKTIENLGGVK